MASRNRSSGNGKSPGSNEIIINASAGETRIAIVEQGLFTELHIEREDSRSVAGMVVKGRVTRVLPGMQAAFVDIGLEKAAFLYVGDYLDEHGQLDPDSDEDSSRGRRGRNGSYRTPPKIETLIHEGQEVVVQVAKEPIGTKGARITSHVSIAGRHLVLTPWSKRVGVSRRIESDRERRRLRDTVTRARPDELGFIIRTAGEGTRDADLEADVAYLASAWNDIQILKDQKSAPAVLHTELSLPLRSIRDFANARTKRIVIDDPTTHEQMESFLSRFVADPKPKLELYDGDLPIFDHFKVESTIDDNLGKKVWLKSGGYLIIDQSEALTAIDVNTGRFVGKRDLEETVYKTNLEAVQEVVYQLRFRNIGGLIIIDLIDMESAENRDQVYRSLQSALRHDKARTNILKISELGLVEMTRKRTRENLVQLLCEPCSHCEGRGYLASAETVAFKVLREIRKDLPRFCGRQIALTVNPRVAEMLLGTARKATQALRDDLGREIEIRARPGLHQEQFEVTALDEGPPVGISVSWLSDTIAEPEKASSEPEVADAKDTSERVAEAAPEPATEPSAEAKAPTEDAEAPTPAAEPETADATAENTPDADDAASAVTDETVGGDQPESGAVTEAASEAAPDTAIAAPEEGSTAVDPARAEEPSAAPDDSDKIPATRARKRVEAATESLQTVDAPEENPIIPRFPNPEEP
jgi:ribonuclease G